jgi:hypothetical protein
VTLPQELLAQLEASRRFSVRWRGAEVACLLPSDLDMRMASARALGAEGRVVVPLAQHEMAAGAVVGWEGMTIADLLEGGGDAPLPYDPLLVRPLLAQHIDIEDAIAEVIYERRDAREAARKNSQSVSPGS